MWELKRGFTAFHAAAGFGNQRTQESIHMFGLAVVRVKGYENVVLFSQTARCFRQNNGAKGGIAYGAAGGEFAATDGNLNDTVAFGFGKARRAPLMTSIVVTLTAG